MSRVRGVFPLFLATTFGIINGVFVFGPAFKEQQQEKEEQSKKSLEIANRSDEQVTKLHQAEVEASRSAATESALTKKVPSSSWWPSLSLWTRHTSNTGADSTIAALANDPKSETKKVDKE